MFGGSARTAGPDVFDVTAAAGRCRHPTALTRPATFLGLSGPNSSNHPLLPREARTCKDGRPYSRLDHPHGARSALLSLPPVNTESIDAVTIPDAFLVPDSSMALHMRFTPLTLCCLVIVNLAGTRLLQAEEVVKTHPDGTVSEQYEVGADGRKEGRYSRIDKSGATVEQATYKADRLHGLRRTWTADGSRLTAWTYKLGVLHGSHKTYGPDGARGC